MILLSLIVLGLAALPAAIYLGNLRQFRPPPHLTDTSVSLPQISVLIPARNEESSIADAVESVLSSTGVELEVIVLDDHSTDRTAKIVQSIAARDSRVRVELAPPLPDGWCGKQHACYALAKLAKYDVFTFLDADARVTSDAIARMNLFRRQSGATLVSGFPRQETETILEKLVIPLINWLLMCYLPMARMRSSLQPGLGAGCGQWFLTTRDAYEKVGGHAIVRSSLHDGVTLPRAYRRAGLMTDICDATVFAKCRMYRSAGQVWNGLAKNAREGLGAWPLILLWTVLLLGGQVMPFVMIALGLDIVFHGEITQNCFPDVEHTELQQIGIVVNAIAVVACLLAMVPRIHCAYHFRASYLGAVLHPVGIVLLLAIQWYATVRAWFGTPVGWKGRGHPNYTSSSSATV